MKTLKQGFTLIELLVVIAIIGILAAVVFSQFGGVRDDAQLAAAQATGRGLTPAMSLCINANATLVTPSTAGATQGAATTGAGAGTTQAICTGSATTWPDLPGDYFYSTATGDFVDGSTNINNMQFTISDAADPASPNAGETVITCLESGCTSVTS